MSPLKAHSIITETSSPYDTASIIHGLISVPQRYPWVAWSAECGSVTEIPHKPMTGLAFPKSGRASWVCFVSDVSLTKRSVVLHSLATEPDSSIIRYFPATSSTERRVLETVEKMTTARESSFDLESVGGREDYKSFALPEFFWAQYFELFDLKHGWDGQDEEPPTAEVLSEVFRIAQEIAKYSYKVTHESRWPELAPGFRGEVGLEYFSEEKELCVEVEPADDRPPIVRILQVCKDEHGRIIDMVNLEPHNLERAVTWLLK